MPNKPKQFIEKSIALEDQTLTLQVGRLAPQATTAIYARMGDTVVLVTLMVSQVPAKVDYLPLYVEYIEKLYAGGRIKGSRWVKREGRPSDEAVLHGRMIDRAIRPLFPKGFNREIQIIVTLLSVDGVNSPEVLSSIAASAAIALSPLNWKGPIATTRVGYVKGNGAGNFVINPTESEQKLSTLDLVVTSTRDRVVMLETQAHELPEEVVIEGIKKAKEVNVKVIDFIQSFAKEAGKAKEEEKVKADVGKLDSVLKTEFGKELGVIIDSKANKEFDDGASSIALVDAVMLKYPETYEKKDVATAVDSITKAMIKDRVLKTKKRIDGRGPDDIRQISCEIGVLPRTHGTGIFNRGETQVLSIATLGAPSLEQLIEGPEGEEAKRYIHHYYMPPFSVGEVGRIGFTSRREIGHGALAEKAIEPVLPTQLEFPYTIRVVSEVLSSNGSTSMASTCGSSLALMDAGVPIKAPIAGIAMGLFYKSDKDYVILTDILGIEDFSGDMDFKVAGSREGVTAVQLDVKNEGLNDSMITEAFQRAKKARLYILDKMEAVIKTPRGEVSKFAPKIIVLTPPADKIGEIIGPGGKNIRSLIARTQTDINVSDDGKVTISGVDQDKVEEAAAHIENITREVEVGEEFEGEVMRLLPFGAFVQILPGKDGLVHVSKMGKGFVKDPADVVKIGQKVKVKVYEIDKQGRINLQLLT